MNIGITAKWHKLSNLVSHQKNIKLKKISDTSVEVVWTVLLVFLTKNNQCIVAYMPNSLN